MKTRAIIGFLVFSLAVPVFAETPSPAPAVASAAAEPGAELKGPQLELKKHLESLYESSKRVNAKGAERTRARNAIENALDWNGIARTALGTQEWTRQSAENRAKFQNLLRQIIAKTAYTRLDTFWDGATYEFKEIEVNGNKAVVKAEFNAKDDVVLLQYYLTKIGSKWLINDLAYEDIRYSVTIGEQVSAFLNGNNFAGLLAKLRKRLEELETKKT